MGTRARTLSILLLVVASSLVSPSRANEPGELRILSYNLWHARVRMKRAEPDAERVARHRLQIEAIRAVDPDLVFLQEVSPATDLGKIFAEELGLDLAAAVSNCGVQMRLPGKQGEFGLRIGTPRGLVEGQAILARHELGLDRERRVKLSGPPALVTSGMCLQFAEVEYAALAAIAVPGIGALLVADAHLHSSAVPDDRFWSDLSSLVATGEVPEEIEAKLKRRVAEGDERRLREAGRLVHALDELRARLERDGVHVAGTIVAGDFNAAPASDVLALLREHDLEDVVALSAERAIVTWDPVENAIIHRVQALPGVARRPFAEESEALARLYEGPAGQIAPRRIDYVLLSRDLAPRVRRVERFAPRAPDGTDLSDHYGLLVVLDR
jgi:endonuclease/exonuclease/phosphatase family metal-dependent hydrolase